MDGTGRELDYPAQTIQFAPIAPNGLTAMYSSDGTSATLTWVNQSTFAVDFLVQKLAPGATDWTTVATVPVHSDPTDESYTYTVSSLDASSTDGEHLLRVLAQGPATSSVAGGSGSGGKLALVAAILAEAVKMAAVAEQHRLRRPALHPHPIQMIPMLLPEIQVPDIYDITVGGKAIGVGGTVDWPLIAYYNGPSFSDLTATSSDPQPSDGN